jgi:hypothetical protein
LYVTIYIACPWEAGVREEGTKAGGPGEQELEQERPLIIAS